MTRIVDSSTVTFLPLAAFLTFASYKILGIIHDTQSSSYIDEIFHVPQAQRYCKNQWLEWDPKITTLPGLYIVSYILLKPLGILGYNKICSLYALRFTNVIASILNFYLALKICSSLEKKYRVKSPSHLTLLTAFNIAIFPPLYFFTFLFYTDVWSTTFVLLMYHSHLSSGKIFKISGVFASVMAVLMRQTNIIWVGLMIIDEAWNVLCKNNKSVAVQDYKYTVKIFKSVILDCFGYKTKKLKRLLTLISDVLSRVYHYVIVCLLFGTFVYLNGSVVLGDKQAHTATFHPMQYLYFLDFVAFFGFPFFISEARSVWKKPPNIFLTIFFIGLAATLSEINKLEHPYLLADNRHLAFYLWKRIFGHRLLRRLVVPTYVASAFLLHRLMQKKCHFMLLVGLSVCTFLNLTLQHLFELRYFIIPFIMFRLQFKSTNFVFLETTFFIVLNAVVLYLFLNRTFAWPSEPDVSQRLIW